MLYIMTIWRVFLADFLGFLPWRYIVTAAGASNNGKPRVSPCALFICVTDYHTGEAIFFFILFDKNKNDYRLEAFYKNFNPDPSIDLV